MKFGDLILGTFAVIGAAAVAENEIKQREKITRNTIGVLNIPEGNIGELRHCRITINGSRISYVDKDSWIQSNWSLPFASFRAFNGKTYGRIEIEDYSRIGPDAVLMCRTSKGTGYINIHVTR